MHTAIIAIVLLISTASWAGERHPRPLPKEPDAATVQRRESAPPRHAKDHWIVIPGPFPFGPSPGGTGLWCHTSRHATTCTRTVW
jgi:hypothetical protein